MKKNLSRVIGVGLSLTMIAGCTFATFGSTTGVKENQTVVKNETKTDDDFSLSSLINSNEADKQETVYVITEADGTVKKVIVSELLKNSKGLDTINDVTNLDDIKNVKSDAAYTLSGTSCVWDADGEDIYYQGTTDEELPVSFTISFKLDGKSVSADEIAGKSGKVEMTFNYINNCTRKVTIDGKEETMNVPFLMLSGMILDNSKFKNIQVENGKIIDDGDKSVVAGFALPGLAENLNVDELNDKIPSSVTITADVTDFELATTLTLATNSVFGKINLDDVSTLDELEDKLDLLDSSMKQIVDGSSELYGYMSELAASAPELSSAVDTLAGYATQISDSVDKLYGEGITVIDSKLKELTDGLSQISGNSATLNAGAKQVYDTLIATVQSQLADAGLEQLGVKVPTLTISNFDTELDKLIAALDENSVKTYATNIAKQKVTQTVKANESTITAAVTEAVRAQVESTVKETVVKPQVLAAVGLTADQYAALPDGNATKQAIDAQITAQMSTDTVKAAINQQMATDKIKKTISDNVAAQETSLIEENMKGTEVTTQIATAVATAKAGKTSLQSAKASLDAYREFYEGVLSYTGAVDTAANGGAQLYAGYNANITANMQTLSSSLHEYVAGMNELNGKVPTLTDAIDQLKDGAKTLSDGCAQFYEEGIKGIIDALDDVTPVFTRLKATFDIAGDYQSYGGISDDMTGETKFIYRTEAIKAE